MNMMFNKEDSGTTRYYIKNRDKVKSNREYCVCRSSWEQKFCQWCDMNKSVLYWESEPIAINYIQPIKQRDARYYPDFLLKCKTPDGVKVWLVEVKPFKETHPPRRDKRKTPKTLLYEQTTWLVNKAKWQAALKHCKYKGWVFKIITEKQLFK